MVELTKHSWVFPIKVYHSSTRLHWPVSHAPSCTHGKRASWWIFPRHIYFYFYKPIYFWHLMYMTDNRTHATISHQSLWSWYLSACVLKCNGTMLYTDLGIWEYNSSPRAYRRTQTIWVFWDAGSLRTDRRRPSRTAHQINRRMGFIWRLCLCQTGLCWLKWSPRPERRRGGRGSLWGKRESCRRELTHTDAHTHTRTLTQCPSQSWVVTGPWHWPGMSTMFAKPSITHPPSLLKQELLFGAYTC